MKRALGIIILSAFKSGNVTFPKIGNIIFVSVRLGKRLNFHELGPTAAALFLGHISCGAHAFPLFVNKLKDRVRVLADFYLHTFHNRKNFAKVNYLKEGRAHA